MPVWLCIADLVQSIYSEQLTAWKFEVTNSLGKWKYFFSTWIIGTGWQIGMKTRSLSKQK